MSGALFHIYAGPGSPYSHKMRAVFRYRRIPHTWLVPQGGFDGGGLLGSDKDGSSPLLAAGKGVVPVIRYPDGEYKADSTPIMYELERLYQARSIIPPNAGIAFLAHLIEDMADEYLPMPMFYFRWKDDAEWCGRRQMIGWNGALGDEVLETMAARFLERQQNQLGARAALPRETVMENYVQILDGLEAQLKKSFFLFGTRPSFAEFGLYGQLSQYVVDPTVSNIMKERAIRTFEWEHFLEDLSGIEGAWWEPEDCLTAELIGVISAMSPMYFAMMQMLQQTTGMDDLDKTVNGMKYRVKCYLALKQELASLSEADRGLIRPVLEASGCWQPLQFVEGERDKVVAIVPA